MGLFRGPDTSRLEARVARVERMLTMVLEQMGLELPAHPAADAIREAVDGGRKIEAIKLYREATGAGLAEAKDAIDHGTWELDLRTHI